MLIEKLDKYLNNNYYPFHMPGHKRNKKFLNDKLPYDRDITEIKNFDNLNSPESLYINMEKEISNIYNVNNSLITTNGSTCGILAAIRTLSKKYKKILISRNSHKSVYNAIELFDLDSDYIKTKINDYGIVCDIDFDDFHKKISNNKYDLVLVTSPSYEGYMIDLKKVHKICKNNHTPLLVDMAHGSHINLFNEYSSNFEYDIAVTSFHKNLSALTQASCILVKSSDIDVNELRRNLAIFQTSSPSYVITQSIDDMLVNYPKFTILKDNLDIYLEIIYKTKIKKLEFVKDINKDKSKIVISTMNTNISGYKLQELLYENKIEIEMAQSDYVVLISTIFDKKSAFDKLKKSLLKIDSLIEYKNNPCRYFNILPIKKEKIAKALSKDKKYMNIDNLKGEVSAEYIYSYPPGIPIILPGEVFTSSIINHLKYLDSIGTNLSVSLDKIALIN